MNNEDIYVTNALKFIRTRQDLIDFVIDKDNSLKSTGFMWSNDPRVNEIGNALMDDGHSGASFGCTLRVCQKILRENNNNGGDDSNDPPPIPPIAFPVNDIIEAEVVTSDNNKSKNVSQSFVGFVKSIVNSNIYSNMDDNNKKAMDVMESEGPEASMKHMFTRDDGSIRSYAEMRALYG